MNDERAAASEADLSGLRAIIARIDREMSELPAPASEELRANWRTLVDRLALGPAAELRDCPACGRGIRRNATRCGYCWTALAPPADPR